MGAPQSAAGLRLGGIGAAAFRMGTEISRVLATGSNWLMVPHTVKLVIKGTAKAGVHARDIGFVIGAKIAAPADQGGFGVDIDYRILEFAGELDQFRDGDQADIRNHVFGRHRAAANGDNGKSHLLNEARC